MSSHRVTPDGYRRLQLHDPCLECNACGAVVASPGRHDEWHDGLIDRLMELAELYRYDPA